MVLLCSVSVGRCNEVTIDSVDVTQLLGNYYAVKVTGTLKLKDLDGTYEIFASFGCYLTDPNGAKYPMQINYTAPTLKKDGSFTATANVNAIPNYPQWKTLATMNAYTNAKMEYSVGSKGANFNIPK